MIPRATQQNRLLAMLAAAHGEWVSLPQILELKISQFGARLLELRRQGHVIRNRTEHKDGKVLSWYMLVTKPNAANAIPTTEITPHEKQRIAPANGSSFPQFGSLTKEEGYPD